MTTSLALAPLTRRARAVAALGMAMAGVSLSLVSATPAHAFNPSITACSFSDGTTETATYRVEQSADVAQGSGPDLTMTIQPSDGYFWNEVGYVNRETGEFGWQGGGMRSPNVPVTSYSPPADVAHYIASQRFGDYYESLGFTMNTHYFEWRFYASQNYDVNTGRVDPSATPLCVVTVDLAAVSDVTVVGGEGGTVDSDLSSASPGDTVTLTATPNAGFTFSSWECTSGDIADPTSPTTTVTNISADTTCTATFAPAEADEPDVAEELAATGTDNASSAVLLAGLLMVLGLGAVMLARATARTSR